MFLPRQFACSLVEKLHALIHLDLAFIDVDGIIQVSTETHRNGQFHPVAYRLVMDDLLELSVYENDAKNNVKAGLHTAIRHDGKLVGVIGITGNPDELRMINQIVKEFTEAIIRDLFLQEQRQIEATARASFVEEWLFHPISNISAFRTRASLLNLDPSAPRIVAIIKASDSDENSPLPDAIKIQQILKSVRHSKILQSDDLLLSVESSIIIILHALNEQNVQRRAESVKAYIHQSYGLSVYGGISAICTDPLQLNNYYRDASRAAALASIRKAPLFLCYNNISVELLVQSIPTLERERFLNRIWGTFPREKLPETIQTLNAYFDANGSVSQAASQLFIHKNTLQYRLNRVTELTGYDPHTLRDALSLQLSLIALSLPAER